MDDKEVTCPICKEDATCIITYRDNSRVCGNCGATWKAGLEKLAMLLGDNGESLIGDTARAYYNANM